MALKDTQMERLVHYQPLWGNWQVGKKIGYGTFSNVYLLHDYNEIEPDCVLKVVTIEYNRNMRHYGYTKQSYLKYALDKKKEEIRIHARLSACPNIVSYQNYAIKEIYDENHELEGYDLLLRMEKLRTLNDWQDDGNRLDEAGLIRLATHICRALRDGGKCGEGQRGGRLVHRDIKPANIYVSKFGEFKLGDFGESRIDVTHSLMSYHGSLLYMAPEIYHHQKNDWRADLYSLGIVLYEIANDGVMPFFDPSKGYEAMTNALDERMSGTPVPKLTGVSAELAELIAKAVEFYPRNRWQSAEDMLAALEQCGKRPQTVPETARARSMDKTAPETARTRPVDQTVPLVRKTQPLDPDELYRRAKAAYAGENYEEAVRLFRLSADAGNAEAMERLGNCYFYGRGVDEDKAQAAEWYQKAVRLFRLSADAGNAEAMYRLGNCYFYGRGVDRDEAQAAVWYRKGAEAGNATAMNILGNFYRLGIGVNKDEAQAVVWYRKGAEAGNAAAMCRLGYCYEHGEGVDKDKAHAVVWYRKAAEAGNANAMVELGDCYYYGWGVDKDYTQAAEWYRKAVRAGSIYRESAKKKLKVMRRKGRI